MAYQYDFSQNQTGEFLARSMVRGGRTTFVLRSPLVVEHDPNTVLPMKFCLHDAPESLRMLIQKIGLQQGKKHGSHWAAQLSPADLATFFAALPINQRIQVLDTSQSTSQRSVSIVVDGVKVLSLDNTIGWTQRQGAECWNGSFARFDPKKWMPVIHEMLVKEVESRGFGIDWNEPNLVKRIYVAGSDGNPIEVIESDVGHDSPTA